MQNITYIFSSPRKERYFRNLVEAKEFYYGLFSFNSNQYKIDIIEFNNSNSSNVPKSILKLFDKIMTKIFSLPFYTSRIVNKENYNILKKTDYLYLINENVGCSVLPMLFFLRKRKEVKISLFVMGLYSKKQRFPIFNKFHFFLVKILVSNVDNVFFLGKGELNKAKTIHPKMENKLHYFPFSIDTEFWREKNKVNLAKKDKIIFIGNDGNRDSKLLIEIAKGMPEFKFTFISKIPELQEINLKNVEIISGSWGDKEITDTKLKNLYLDSRLTIIPLKESYQPSGQSVALQSMSLGIPVIISSTRGFWDEEAFEDKVNILFEKDNTAQSWIKKINKVYKDIDLLNTVSKNAQKNIDNNFNLTKFNSRLNEFI